jgi:solute:Na+ symporter, SSS family
VGGTAVFYAAILSELLVVSAWLLDLSAFLWLNVIGCIFVLALSALIQIFINKDRQAFKEQSSQ